MSVPPDRREGSSALLTAAVSGLLLLATFFVQSPEGPKVGSATADQIRAFVADHGTGMKLGATGGAASLVLIVLFTASLAQLVRNALPGSIVPGLVSGGGIVLGAILLLDTAAHAMPLLLPDLVNTELGKVDDATVVSWYGLTGYTHFLGDFSMAPVALAITAFSIAARKASLLPRWLTWLGLVVGASAAIGTLGVTTASGPLYWFWFGGLLGWALWILFVSVTLGLRWNRLRRPIEEPAAV
jgi:hypothetical protein